MKARVKATGNIIEVIPYTGFDDYDYYEPEEKMPWLKEELVFDVTDKDDIYNKGWQAGGDEAVKSEIPKIHPKLKGSDPDYWEKLKHQYAGMAMQGIMANSLFMPYDGKEIAELSDTIATALVGKLKEGKV